MKTQACLRFSSTSADPQGPPLRPPLRLRRRHRAAAAAAAVGPTAARPQTPPPLRPRQTRPQTRASRHSRPLSLPVDRTLGTRPVPRVELAVAWARGRHRYPRRRYWTTNPTPTLRESADATGLVGAATPLPLLALARNTQAERCARARARMGHGVSQRKTQALSKVFLLWLLKVGLLFYFWSPCTGCGRWICPRDF